MGNLGKGLEGFGGAYKDSDTEAKTDMTNGSVREQLLDIFRMKKAMFDSNWYERSLPYVVWRGLKTGFGDERTSGTAAFFGKLSGIFNVWATIRIGRLVSKILPEMRRMVALAILMESDTKDVITIVSFRDIYDKLGVGPHLAVLMPNRGGFSLFDEWRDVPALAKIVEDAVEEMAKLRREKGNLDDGLDDDSGMGMRPRWKRGPDGKFDFSKSHLAQARKRAEKAGMDEEQLRETAISAMRQMHEDSGSMPIFAEATAFMPLADEVRRDAGLRRQLGELFRIGGFRDFADYLDLRKELTKGDDDCTCPGCQLALAYEEGEAGDTVGKTQGNC